MSLRVEKLKVRAERASEAGVGEMTHDERSNHRISRIAPISRVQVRVEQRETSWFLEDLAATLTLVAILIGIVVARLVTIG